MITILYSTLQQGLIYGLLAIGIYISFRILDVPDLTTEGSFGFGLAVSAMFTLNGLPFLGLFCSMIAGFIAGIVTGLLQTKLKIHPILAGIITMSGLYSVNLLVQNNAPNVSLLKGVTMITIFGKILPNIDKEIIKIILPFVLVVLVVIILTLFFKTHFGLCIRATGDNSDMLRASSVNVDITKTIALGISNACIAFSGGLLAQIQGYSDISSSTGILVVGLASVIIGETIFGKRSVLIGLISAVVGSMVYRLIIAIVIKYQILPPFMFKFVSAVIVAIALAIPAIQEMIRKQQLKQGGKKHAGN